MIPFPFQTKLKNSNSPTGSVRGLGLPVVCYDSTGLVAEDVLFTQDYHHRIPCPRQVPLIWKCLKPLQHLFVSIFISFLEEKKKMKGSDHFAGAMIRKRLEMHLCNVRNVVRECLMK